jgi:GTP-binding protein
MPPIPMRFVTSAGRVAELPPTEHEVAIVGRSNVGKSSLINALANRQGLARVSQTPGQTQRLNLFRVGPSATIMDLPGYGFAKVPGRVKATWDAMISGYLLEREGLEMVVVLVDGEVGPTKLDLQMLDWLRATEVPHHVVATKQDKVKPSTLGTRRRDVAAAVGLLPEDVSWVSASKGTGIEALRDLLRTWLGER